MVEHIALKNFVTIINNDPDINPGVAAIQSLLILIRECRVETLSELRETLKRAVSLMTSTGNKVTSISSGCELFLRFITLTSLDQPNVHECTRVLLERGQIYLEKVKNSRQKIAKICDPFINDGDTLLVHSYSKVVFQSLLYSAKMKNKNFRVYVTESGPDMSGIKMMESLSSIGINCVEILDSAVGYIMEKVDLILLGAEGVVENGGIINKIGSYTIALVAKAYNKRVYVCVESFKFVRLYPLNQADIPEQFKYLPEIVKLSQFKQCKSASITPENQKNDRLSFQDDNKNNKATNTEFDDIKAEVKDLTTTAAIDYDKYLEAAHPYVDYTPPEYLTLLFTDLGVLTPSAVSDELIKLYS